MMPDLFAEVALNIAAEQTFTYRVPERLREEAQAHTARAVNDLKGTFEAVITQIGRQLEQMRGQFDNTSRGMREAKQ